VDFDTHQYLLDLLDEALREQSSRTFAPLLSRAELARRAGLTKRSINRIYAGTPASEATWDKLFAAAGKE
jgi:hypothetical protein